MASVGRYAEGNVTEMLDRRLITETDDAGTSISKRRNRPSIIAHEKRTLTYISKARVSGLKTSPKPLTCAPVKFYTFFKCSAQSREAPEDTLDVIFSARRASGLARKLDDLRQSKYVDLDSAKNAFVAAALKVQPSRRTRFAEGVAPVRA